MAAQTVQVIGLPTTVAELEKLRNVDIRKAIREAARDSALIVARLSVPRAPVLTGALARSINVRASAKSAAVKAGGGVRVPYAAVIHWGWPRHNIEPTKFIYEAADQAYSEVERTFTEAVEAIAERAGAIGPKIGLV